MTTTWLPGATVRDLSGGYGNGPFSKFLGVVLHVNVDEVGTPIGFWGPGNSGSVVPNFQVFKDGTVDQLLPFNWQPWCQVNGNFNYAAIETAGMPGEPLTDAQCAAIAHILGIYHVELGMPLTVADSPGQAGFGIHSMGGQAWGGHSCPGDIRANQRIHILALAQGGSPTEDDLSAAAEAMIKDLHDRLGKIDTMAFNVNGGGGQPSLRAVVGAMATKLSTSVPGATTDVTALADAIAAELGPDLGQELVTALGTALTQKPAGQ